MPTFQKIKKLGIPIGFSIDLSHDEIHDLALGANVAAILAPLPPQGKAVVAGIAIGATVLEGVCLLGGHKGVTIRRIGPTAPFPFPRMS